MITALNSAEDSPSNNPRHSKGQRSLRSKLACIAALSAGLSAPALAQTAPAAAADTTKNTNVPVETTKATAAAPEDDVLELSPFVVSSDDDKGYAAKSTLAGTRVRTDLADVASAISVVNKQFLLDTGATDNQTLLQYTTNTEVGGMYGNFSGSGGGRSYNENGNLLRPNENTRVRGLDSADNTRDYFLTEIPWDGYIVDRVDLQRGPNSILFGVGSPAGIINTSINTPSFKNRNYIENRVGIYGSIRNAADFNYVLVPKTLAVRVALLDNNTKYQQSPAYNHDKRVFGAVKYSGHPLGENSHTEVRANFEAGSVEANRPRTLPPVDAVTPWFQTGTGDFGAAGLNKAYYDQTKSNKGNAPYSSNAWLKGDVGRLFWNDVVGYYGNNGDSNPTLLQQPVPSGNLGIGPNGARDNGIGGIPSGFPFAVSSYSVFATNAGGDAGAFYTDRSLSDTSVFDFFNKLIDGSNSHQWQKWQAGNIAVSQTFFHDRLGFELVNDVQRYQDGQRAFLGASDTYKLGIELNSILPNGAFNGGDTINNATGAAGADGIGDNVGRIYVASSNEQANSKTKIDRDSVRFTTTGELRAEDLWGKGSTLSRILGRHVFTGLLSQDTKKQSTLNWATSAASVDYPASFGAATSLTAHFRSYDYINYISNSLLGQSSASGANADMVRSIVKAPSGSAMVNYFDNKWAKSTNPTDPNYVNPAAPYTFVAQNTGVVTTSTQSENPANYGGWKQTSVKFYNADDGDINALTYDAGKQKTTVKSKSVTWQGYMFDNNFVPVFGWRRDEITSRNGSAKPDSDTGIVNASSFDYNAKVNNASGESRSWGGVLKLPRQIAEKLPAGINANVFFNRSENFRADLPRGDVFGNVVPNQSGSTKEYGVVISALDEKIALKINWYETKVANATLGGGTGLGQNGYYLWAVPAWGTAFVANADQGLKGNNDGNSWAWNYASADDSAAPNFRNQDGTLNAAFQNHPSTIAEKAAINAWRDLPLTQTFFNAYGNEVALIQAASIKTGDWTAADPIWNKKFDNQPVSGGLLAGFGSAPVTTVDTVSKGTEFELTAQPTKNWSVSVNVAKTFASRQKLAPTIEKYIKDMTTFLDGPAGDIRLWGGGASNSMRVNWKNNIVNPYNTLIAQQGSNAPEIAPWRFNGVTNYNFTSGALKGFHLGGALRWEQARVLGYEYSAALKAIDVTKPLKGKDDTHLDLWVGYSRKLTSKINWSSQLNLRSIGEKTKLVAVTINPDNTTGFSRIQQGMTWQFTNSFEF